MEIFEYSSELPHSLEEVFSWHEGDSAFELLTPPWEKVRLIHKDPGLAKGVEVELEIGLLPFVYIRSKFRHELYEKNRRFVDVQIEGPFSLWRHEHVFESLGEQKMRMLDRVFYAVPGGKILNFLLRPFLRRKLEKLFEFRHQALKAALLYNESPS